MPSRILRVAPVALSLQVGLVAMKSMALAACVLAAVAKRRAVMNLCDEHEG